MQYQEEFLDLLNDIEIGLDNKTSILDFKDFIKTNLVEGTKLVHSINNMSKVDPDYEVFKETIDGLSNNLVKIYNIDKNIFGEILIYSGFTNDQVDLFSSAIESSEDKVEEMTYLLAESYFKDINILQNPNSKKIMSRKNYEDKSDNQFSEFIEYILEGVLPAQAMENIAKLSIFQRTKLETVIKNDPTFKNILEKFKNGESIPKNEKNYVRNKIETNIADMFKNVPVYKYRNGVGYVTIQPELGHFNIWEKTAGRNRPDAYGIDNNGTLYVATVTSNTNFENQNNQSIEWANYIENGIKINMLKNIKDFKVIICCNPILNDLDEKGTLFKEFRREIKNLEQSYIISKNEIDSLKRLAVDVEILSMFRNVSLEKYQKLRDKLEFSVLGENFIIVPKEMNEQYKESINNLDISLGILNKIILNNSMLEKMQTPFKFLVEAVSEGAYNGLNSPLKENQNLEDTINSIKKSMSSLKKELLTNGHDSFKPIKSGIETDEDIKDTADILDLKYREEKINVSNWNYPLEQSELSKRDLDKLKKGTHSCYFDDSLSSNSQLSQIMAMTYNKGNICESLMNDAMIFQVQKINNRFHKSSLNMLVTGINNVYNSRLPYDLTKTFKFIIKYNLQDKVSNSLTTNSDLFKNNIIEIQEKISKRKNKPK